MREVFTIGPVWPYWGMTGEKKTKLKQKPVAKFEIEINNSDNRVTLPLS
jgi:hypothetical protein